MTDAQAVLVIAGILVLLYASYRSLMYGEPRDVEYQLDDNETLILREWCTQADEALGVLIMYFGDENQTIDEDSLIHLVEARDFVQTFLEPLAEVGQTG